MRKKRVRSKNVFGTITFLINGIDGLDFASEIHMQVGIGGIRSPIKTRNTPAVLVWKCFFLFATRGD